MQSFQNSLSRRKMGVLLVIISAVVFSTAGIFTNGVEADAWSIIFWRGLAAVSFTFLYMLMAGILKDEIRSFDRPAILVTLLMAAGTIAFIPAFKLSNVANVALIYAAAPFMAAGLARIFLKETPSRIVTLASVAATIGVGIIVSSSVSLDGLMGNMLALCMTLMLAAIMVVYRARPETTAALPAALSSVVLLPVVFFLGEPLETSNAEIPILVLFGLVFAVASVTLSEGARRLPPAETALLSILEMPLAPLLAWLILFETPTPMVIFGGVVVFCAVLWSQIQAE